jgi:hypothetical protein
MASWYDEVAHRCLLVYGSGSFHCHPIRASRGKYYSHHSKMKRELVSHHVGNLIGGKAQVVNRVRAP